MPPWTAWGVGAMIAAMAAATSLPRAADAQVSVDLPLGIGVHLVTYDRVNGASVPFGPTVSIGDDRVVIEPLVTYRSHLGKIDPFLSASWQVDSLVALSVTGARGTFSNDQWIRSDLFNSLMALGLGLDTRNDFRADRSEARATVRLPMLDSSGVFVGVRFERDWSTGWRVGERRGPYSVLGRNNVTNGIQRPNPVIDPGHIASMLAGWGGTYQGGRGSTTLNLEFEGAWHTPLGERFQQVTFHDDGKLRTIAGQQLQLTLHLVTSTGGMTPLQRYAYVGGSGTLATVDVLPLGGDHLYFADLLYVVPVPQVDLPVLGELFVAPHFASGAAASGGFGAPVQNVGIRIGGGVLRLDYLVNPRTHRRELGYGLTLSR